MEGKSEILQGTLDLLILKTVALGANHGLGISRRIAQITRDTFDVKPGSLFPALHRLEERGWVEAHTHRHARRHANELKLGRGEEREQLSLDSMSEQRGCILRELQHKPGTTKLVPDQRHRLEQFRRDIRASTHRLKAEKAA